MITAQERSLAVWNEQRKIETDGATIYPYVRWFIRSRYEPVVVKKHKTPKYFADEAKIQSEARHRHVVELYGVVKDAQGFNSTLILEPMELGDLKTFGMKAGLTGNNSPDLIAVQIVSALVYLKLARIVHRDVKPSNILLTLCADNKILAKLGDFGIARRCDSFNEASGQYEYISYSDSPMGSPGYIAPEIFEALNMPKDKRKVAYDSQSDVFSLAILILCLGMNGRTEPYPRAENVEEVMACNRAHIVPPMTNDLSDFTLKTFLLCFKRDPSERMNADALLERYRRHLKI